MDKRSSEPPSSSRRLRKVLGVVAVAAGSLLLVLERGMFREPGAAGGSCFWIVVAGLLIILGIVELLDRGPRTPPNSES